MHSLNLYSENQKERQKAEGLTDWDRQFNFIVQQFEEGEVSHLDDLTYYPLFI